MDDMRKNITTRSAWNVCLYVCMHACMYVGMYACMCICMYISATETHRAARPPGHVWGDVWAVWNLVFLYFKGPQPSGRFSPRGLCSRFFYYFSILFQNSFFYNAWYQKLLKWKPQNCPKSQQSEKAYHQNAPTVRTCKKTPSGKGQTF